MRTHQVVGAAALVAAVLSGCSGSDEPKKPADVVAPKGFDVPAGVTLTRGGTQLTEDQAASVVHQVGDEAASAITVTVAQVEKGSIKDFRFFSLDDETKKSTPFYVTVTVKNEGPAGLGGGALPLYAHDDSNINIPANDIVGSFKPCPRATLPKSFLPGSSARLCLVYLLPKGRALVSVDLLTESTKRPITWTP